MVFSSVVFLSVFFPVFLLLYFLCRKIRHKNIVLVIFSILFYAWGEPVWVLLLLFSGSMDYLNGRVIGRYAGCWQAKAAVVFSIVVNLGILALFKYSGFIVDNINAILHVELSFPRFTLPVGISFYTFQTLTYTIDTYRGRFKPQKSLISYLTYLTMFPQLVAGPIVRYADVEGRIEDRVITREMFSSGITRFACGLGKKVILANSAGAAASLLLDGDLSLLSGFGAWLGIILFAFQIYFDFSGYSDMAIGMGKMLGFEFKENFDYPYMSKSITEFWRRWHMSLSTFFRDYVYIPLGGNRRMQLRNLCVVWFLTGLWHGAAWNFILWGIYYLVVLVLEKYAIGGLLKKLPTVVGRLYSLLVILGGWMLFYFTDLHRLPGFIKACLFMNGATDYLAGSVAMGHVFLLIACVLACTPYPKRLAAKLTRGGLRVTVPVFNAVMIAVSYILIVAQTYNPFLYYIF